MSLDARDPRPGLPAHSAPLDGLRTLAIGLVIFQHTLLLFGAHGLEFGAWYWRASRAGWWGVDLFFVLSGFLITRILTRTRGAPRWLWTFWSRRAARILPLFYLYLGLVYVYGRLGGFAVGGEPWLLYAAQLANVPIALYDFGLPVFGILWSLAVEEQFYAFWPLVVRGLGRGTLCLVCAAIIALSPLLRWAVFRYTDLPWAAQHVLPFCRADTLALGALVGLLHDLPLARRRLEQAAGILLAPALAALGWITLRGLGPWPSGESAFDHAWVCWGYSVVGLSCAVLLVNVAAEGPLASALFGNPLAVFLGQISYGLYIWHSLLGLLVAHLPAPIPLPLRLAGWYMLSVAVATLSFHRFERPIQLRAARYRAA